MSPRSVALCLLVAALLARPAPARAWCRTTTVPATVPGDCASSGLPLGWLDASCAGFSLYVAGSPDVSMDVLGASAAAAAARWHASPCDANGVTQPYFAIVRVADTGDPTGYDPGGPNANTLSFNSTWHLDAHHRDGTISVTLVSFDMATGQILDADIEFDELSAQNPDGFHFTVDPPGPQDVDLDTILVHEFGHFQGIGHSSVDLAVMWPSAGLGEQRRDLRSDDAEAVCMAYPPGAPAAAVACDPTPRGGFQAVAPSPGCGCRAPSAPARGRRALGLVVLALALVRRRAR